MTPQQAASAGRQLRIITVLLTIQFILGAILTTLLNYDPNKHSVLQIIFLALHIAVAVCLLIAALVRVITSLRWGSLQILSIDGLLSILAAMATGSVAAVTGNGFSIFIMSMGFLVAFGAYGYSMREVSKSLAVKTKPVRSKKKK